MSHLLCRLTDAPESVESRYRAMYCRYVLLNQNSVVVAVRGSLLLRKIDSVYWLNACNARYFLFIKSNSAVSTLLSCARRTKPAKETQETHSTLPTSDHHANERCRRQNKERKKKRRKTQRHMSNSDSGSNSSTVCALSRARARIF